MALIRSLGIKKLRVLHPDHNLLKALANTNVEVNLGIPNEDLRDLALSSEHACQWVSNNIKPYSSSLKIRYISVGNEGIMGEERCRLLVLPAMQNVHNALHYLDNGSLSIQVSTSVGMDVLGKWTTPSNARFLDVWTPFIHPIAEFLAENDLRLMVNVFPYSRYESILGDRSVHWTNSFDAACDAFYYAMEKIGYPIVPIVPSSTGWPSAGGEPFVTTIADLLAYNYSLVRHLTQRKRLQKNPRLPIDAYLFTLFNSKRDPGDKLEWGLSDFNMRLLYRQGFSS
ncbi:hypothetical protein EJ110_NYTH06819 [Nymphaea thermarum]|nr:hypothetical protein EJ110_NYTH06819 [Nymphaea thermarum]